MKVTVKPIHPRILPDRDKWRNWYLDERVKIVIEYDNQILTIELPKGYRFDGHSVPLLFRWLFKRYDEDIVAALVHDVLIEVSPYIRNNRDFKDHVYTHLMNHPEYFTNRFRATWMPKAVKFNTRIMFFWKQDYRGIPKDTTRLKITLDEI